MNSELRGLSQSRIMIRCRALTGRLESALARRSVCLSIAGFSLAFVLAVKTVEALGTALWTDELLTVYVALLNDLSPMSQALRIGVDGQPITWHWVNSLVSFPFIDPHLSFRMLPILGFGMAMIGAMLFVGKRFGPCAGLAAALLVSISSLGTFAIEARPYSVLVGLVFVAASLWQRIEEQQWIPVAFCATLSLATAFHHLAILSVGCFVGAELAFLAAHAKKRWAVWFSLLVATIPFLLNVPALMRFQKMFAEHFWSKAGWSSIPKAYAEMLGVSLTNSLLFMASVGVALAVWMCSRRTDGARTTTGLPAHEIALSVGLVSLPVLLVVVAKVMGGGFRFPYVFPTVIGVVFLLAHYLRLGDSGSRSTWIALSLLLTTMFLHGVILVRHGQDAAGSREPSQFRKWLGDMEAVAVRNGIDPKIPIVMARLHDYLPATYYLGAASENRLYYLADSELAVRYTKADSGDKMMIALREAFPQRQVFPYLGGILDARAFVGTHPQFMVWTRTDFLHTWVTRYLVDSGIQLRLIYDDGRHGMYVATAR